MAKDLKEMKMQNIHKGKPAGMFFILTYIGVLVYFLDKADGFWEVIFSFVQALVWPALLLNKIFTLLQI